MNTYTKSSADASQQYRPTSAAGSSQTLSAAVNGNLADMVKNSTVYRLPIPWPGATFYPEQSVSGMVNRRN